MAHPLAALHRRLTGQYDPAAWPVLLVKAVPAQARELPDALVRTPDHWLAAAWRPMREALERLPEAVVIGSPAADNALAELAIHLPADARLWVAHPDAVDAALAAEALLAADRNLEEYQRCALERFAAAERTRMGARLAQAYTDHDAGFARFRRRLHEE